MSVLFTADFIDLRGEQRHGLREAQEGDRSPFEVDGQKVYLGVNIGVSLYPQGGSEVYFQPKFDLALRRVNSMDLGGMQISINISPLQIRDPNLVGDILAALNKTGVSIEQLALISGLGCDEIQGYLISRPLPVSDITAFLQQQDQQRLSA